MSGEPTHPPTLAGGEPFALGDVVYVGRECHETSEAEHELFWQEFRVRGAREPVRDWFIRRRDSSFFEVAVSTLSAAPRAHSSARPRTRRRR